jgi:TRAP transporter TAXI family solute receptor
MKKIFLLGLALVLVGVFSFYNVDTCSARVRYVTIGTGGVTGVYYPTGGAVGKIVNKKRKQYNLRVTVESTGGSVFNVNAVMAGDLEFGVVQSDRQYQAWNGIKDWKDRGPQKGLRAICSFHPETIILVAADDSGIETFMDLRGKHVSIGNPGSGQRGNSTDALAACGIDWKTDMRAEGIKADAQAKFLQDGRIDAFFYTVGHPDGSAKEATSGKRKVHFVPVTGPCIDELVAKWPFYAKAYVPIKHYPMASNKENVDTFAVKATFVTSAKVPDDIVYAVTKEIFDNLEDFKKLHPAYEVLTRKTMLEALSAPIHPGAMKYYKEVGLK